MAEPVEKDYGHHNGTLNPNYSSRQNANHSSDRHHNGTLNPNYSSEDSGHADYLHEDMGSDQALRRIRTAGSVAISPELFEKLYLSPQNKVSGDFRKRFANPTPLAILGFLISLSPLSCDLMGWRGAGGNGAASVGPYYFFGGMAMALAAIGEFILGNTFPFVVFGSFSAFWLSFGATLTPSFAAYASYSPDPTKPAEGLQSPVFAASFGFWQLAMGILCFVYLICSLRTNVCFVIIFLSLVMAFSFLTGTYWALAAGDAALGAKLTVAAGACTFVTVASGWWIFLAQMLASVDFPISLPVGDLSGLIKGASERKAKKDEFEA